MDYTIHSTADHHGAEIYESWKFPRPGQEKVVTLKIRGREEGGGVISRSEVPLEDVPERVVMQFVPDAIEDRDFLSDVIERAGPPDKANAPEKAGPSDESDDTNESDESDDADEEDEADESDDADPPDN